MFCIYLRTNSDLCHLQHKLIGFYNRDEKCLQRGTGWGLNKAVCASSTADNLKTIDKLRSRGAWTFSQCIDHKDSSLTPRWSSKLSALIRNYCDPGGSATAVELPECDRSPVRTAQHPVCYHHCTIPCDFHCILILYAYFKMY